MNTPSDFARHAAAGCNRIPLMREVLADLDTPVTTWLKLARGPYSYLLESMEGGERWGRYSIIGLPCRELLRVRGHRVRHLVGGAVRSDTEVDDPLAAVREFRRGFKAPAAPGPARFTGGLVGYFGYDTVRYIEPRLGPCTRPDPVGMDDIVLMVSDELVVFDNLGGRLYLLVYADPAVDNARERGIRRLDELQERLAAPLAPPPPPQGGAAVRESDFSSDFTRDAYEAAVERARAYIRDGDIFQVVLSQCLSVPFEASPLDLYRALRTINPSPYMYYLNLDDAHIVGSSPEILVRLEEGEVTVRPIAGTRRRGRNPEEDRALAEELLADPKELAEHLMLLDLGRNDVGKIAQTGSVRPTEKMAIERYSHVMHIVSNVIGRLREGQDAIDVLRATFPAGTLSGAPKVRAMEIIDELEQQKRGVYGGAVGYIGWSGNMDTAIAIRTAVIRERRLYVRAGGGIVADSQPRLEWEESMNKGRAIFRAAAMAGSGLTLAGRH